MTANRWAELRQVGFATLDHAAAVRTAKTDETAATVTSRASTAPQSPAVTGLRRAHRQVRSKTPTGRGSPT